MGYRGGGPGTAETLARPAGPSIGSASWGFTASCVHRDGGGAGNDASGTQVESEPRCLPACEDLPSGGRGAELTNGHVTLALQRVGRGCRRVAVGLWRREDPASTPRRCRGAPGCGVTASQRSGPRVGRRLAMVMISRQRWHRSASGLRAPRRGRAPAPGLSHSGRRTFLGAGAEVTGSCQAFASL